MDENLELFRNFDESKIKADALRNSNNQIVIDQGSAFLTSADYQAVHDVFGVAIHSEHFWGNTQQILSSGVASVPFQSVDCNGNINLFMQVRNFLFDRLRGRW